MSKPKIAEPDWKQMWQNYSQWTTDMSQRHAGDLGYERAKMARGGLVRGSEQWNENLHNTMLEQEKERKKLMQGDTAQELGTKMVGSMKAFGIDWNKPFTQQYKGMRVGAVASQVSAAEKAITEKYTTKAEDLGEAGDYTKTDYGKIQEEKSKISASEFSKAFDKEARQQLKEGKYFEDTTPELGANESGQMQYGATQRRITGGGLLKLHELTTTDKNIFGRKMEKWEAMAYLTMGDPSLQASGKSEEDLALERATKAAGGQATGGTGRTSAEATAVQSAGIAAGSASPWVAKRQYARL